MGDDLGCRCQGLTRVLERGRRGVDGPWLPGQRELVESVKVESSLGVVATHGAVHSILDVWWRGPRRPAVPKGGAQMSLAVVKRRASSTIATPDGVDREGTGKDEGHGHPAHAY